MEENYSYNWYCYYGGDIFLGSAKSLSAIDSKFEDNSAYYGGAIASTEPSTIDLKGCTFDGHWGVYGGAIYLSSSAILTDQGSEFTDNESYYYGGALYNYSSSMTLHDTLLEENTAQYGHGGAFYGYTNAELTTNGAQFIDNTAYYYGGAAYVYYSTTDLEITDTTFDGNTSIYGYGGGLYTQYVNLSLVSSHFTDNEAYYSGGGLYHYYYSTLTIQNGVFEGNEAGQYGGAIYDDKYGGSTNDTTWGVYLKHGRYLRWRGRVTQRVNRPFQRPIFIPMKPTTFPAIAGTVSLQHDSITAENNTLCSNIAYTGGALYQGLTTLKSHWNYNIFQENEATYGGGFYSGIDSDLELINNTFLGNDASYQGGAAYFQITPVTAINNIFAYTLDGDGITGDAVSALSSSFTYNDFYLNLSDDLDGYSFSTTADGNTTDDPSFVDYSLDGDCTNDDLMEWVLID